MTLAVDYDCEVEFQMQLTVAVAARMEVLDLAVDLQAAPDIREQGIHDMHHLSADRNF